MNVIECTNVIKSFGKKKALDELSFTIKENTMTGIIGRNGAGKTTMLRIVAGFTKETSGEVKVFNERPFNNIFISANTIFISDHLDLPSSLSLRELLTTAESFYENWNRALAEKLFTYFNFNPKASYNHLSKGMKSTFNMILGLCARCALTIFDEPIIGMDAAVRKDFYRALLKEYIAYPRTILLSSHHLDEVEDLLEEVLLIKDGKKLLHVPLPELKEWAIGITGHDETMKRYVAEKEIIYSHAITANRSYIVVKNDFENDEFETMRQEGLELSPVSATDVYVYLTDERQGGIDDVFSTT